MFGYLPMCRCITKYIDEEEQMQEQIDRLNKLRNENAYLKLDHKQLNDKLLEEVKELVEDGADIKEELGDVLVVLVELARQNNLDVSDALTKATDKLEGRVKQYNKRMWREFNKEKSYKENKDDCKKESPAEIFDLDRYMKTSIKRKVEKILKEKYKGNQCFKFDYIGEFGWYGGQSIVFNYYEDGEIDSKFGFNWSDLYSGRKEEIGAKHIFGHGVERSVLNQLYNELLDIFYDPKTWDD